jgi:DnaJ-class molecular chaperone
MLRHPDKNPGNEEEAKVRFQKVSAAYKRLIGDDESDGEDEEDWDDYDYEQAEAFFAFV